MAGMRNLHARREGRATDKLKKGNRNRGRGTTGGRRKGQGRDDRKGSFVCAAGIRPVRGRQLRLDAVVVRGRPDMADGAVGVGLEVAGKVVMGERHRGERHEVRRDDDL
jgi:hypothetical protein